MTAGGTPLDGDLPVGFGRAERSKLFHLKSDIPLTDTRLRALRAETQDALRERAPKVAAIGRELRLGDKVTPLASGTFHVVHRLAGGIGSVAVKSTISGLFAQDRGLLLDGFVRQWLAPAALESLVPECIASCAMSAGAPFDFSIASFADGTVLRDLGDDMLDREPACLAGAGRALSRVHTIKGEGAGLLDIEMASAPRGVHRHWEDYIYLLLDEHLDTCIEAGFVDNPLAEAIRELFQAMRPALANRPMRLLHGDLGIHNIVVDPASKDVTALLDWEDALVGDPLFDIAMVSSFHPERRLPAFLQGYGLAQPNPDERRLVALYFLRIALSKTVHRLRFGVRDLAGRTPGHHRIYRGVSELRQLM